MYEQLKRLLLRQILEEAIAPGGRLPTEHELCATYGISRTPVHRALAELSNEGVVVRHRRRGTFVNPHWVRRNAAATEVRVVVPDGPWEGLIRAVLPDDMTLSVVTVDLPSLREHLVHAVAAGVAPDLAVVDSVWVSEFARSGFLHGMNAIDAPWIAGEYAHDFVDAFVASNRWGDSTVAVAAEADVAGLWFERERITGASGRGTPATWRDLERALRAVQRDGSAHPLVLPGGAPSGEATTYCLLAVLASNGAQVVADGAVALGEPAAVEALALLHRMARRGLVPREVTTWPRERPILALGTGQAACALGGSYELPALAAAAGVDLDAARRRFGFAAMPAGPSGGHRTLAGGMVNVIFRQASAPRQAMRLVRRLAEPDAQVRMAEITGQLPARRSALARVVAASPFLADTAAMLESSVVRPAVPSYGRVSQQLQTMLEDLLLGRSAPAAAARHTAELVAAITGLPLRGG
ncbi:MAG: extracellular solute-binding protein [Pseudonocardia sp.]|nr:extracellular solute-binding protein [Pseudonocardia sp.]